jgi:hypothetical protein
VKLTLKQATKLVAAHHKIGMSAVDSSQALFKAGFFGRAGGPPSTSTIQRLRSEAGVVNGRRQKKSLIKALAKAAGKRKKKAAKPATRPRKAKKQRAPRPPAKKVQRRGRA